MVGKSTARSMYDSVPLRHGFHNYVFVSSIRIPRK